MIICKGLISDVFLPKADMNTKNTARLQLVFVVQLIKTMKNTKKDLPGDAQ